jgi:hypothetical protein
MKNIYLGQTCVIIGNGPSLRNVPFGFLCQYPTFGQNKIYLRFIPDFFVCVCKDANEIVKGEPVIDWKKVWNLPSKKFLREHISRYRPDYELHITNEHKFCMDPLKEVYEGYSVTFVSLQLAFWMGFTTALLVGVDFRYTPYDEQTEIDPNHFIKEYNGLTNFTPRSLENGKAGIIESMTLAREAYARDDRTIFNLSEGTALEVFEKQSINDWYKKEQL